MMVSKSLLGGIELGGTKCVCLIGTGDSLNGYIDLERLTGGLERYVIPPGLGTLAGPLGALALAADAI